MLCFIPIGLISCKSNAERLTCLEEHFQLLNQDQEYLDIKADISLKIKEWSKLRLRYMTRYQSSYTTWTVDEFAFNEDKSRIFGWILKVDNQQVNELGPNDRRGDILDYVKYFAGEKIDGNWEYYVHNMPFVWFARDENESKPYSFEQLSIDAKNLVVKGGLIKRRSCTIDYDFVDNWMEREGQDMHKRHQEFLNSKEDF